MDFDDLCGFGFLLDRLDEFGSANIYTWFQTYYPYADRIES